MSSASLLYHAILVLYALSLLFILANFVGTSRQASKTGTGLLVVVWLLQAAFFLQRMFELRYVPVVTMYETVFFFSWAVVTLALVLFILFRQEIVVHLLAVCGFAIVLAGLWFDPGALPWLGVWDKVDGLLLVHITAAVCGYAAMTVAALLAGIYAFQHRKLRLKQWSVFLQRLPSLDLTEHVMKQAVLVGFLLLAGSIGLALVWVVWNGNARLLADRKVLVSLAALLVYGTAIVRKRRYGMTGRTFALWIAAGYAIILLNYIGADSSAGFHDWFGGERP